MIKNKAGWVALTVLAAATALMIFVVQPNLRGGKEASVDGAANGPAQTTDAASSNGGPQPSAGASNEAAASATDAKAPAEDPSIPGFDVLRVEPDGSTVVAGHAAPGSKLEILNGTTVVGTADVGVTGDFAAVFDKPLPAGDYQLTLRAVGEDGVAKNSHEVATVSVPKDPTGQLLAMVSKPGAASRLLTTPDALAGASQPADASASQPAAGTSADVASATAQTTSDATAAKPSAAAGLQVTAVEIEGAKMFVAGSAKPGALVRIYADDKLLGEIEADDKGHFVVDGQIDLSVGSHIIRADMLSDDASKVVMRASVPFDRPAGSQVAAIAGPVSAAATAGLDGLRAEAGKALALLKGLFSNGKVPTGEQLAAARSASEFALKSLADFRLTDNSDQALADEAARTSKAAADALAVLKEASHDPSSVATALTKVEASVGAILAERGSVTPAVAAKAQPAASGEVAEASGASKVKGAGSSIVNDVAAAQPSVASAKTQAQPETVEQAPLKESKSSVIIRRGDTLWQISRRVYGAGVRYTTIYLANQAQIENPDRIRPGQVFGVPDQALSDEESREIHKKHMKHEQ
ncbi:MULTISPECIES: LysM peptidoglycan-binding domain-containing protein [unclassified Ensifer]|uniref:LysM peptidoglycan-binding domain-containing protein n=1 Tax=unclassified Ensifer TaxID=2633371 RepID=UPI000813C982|nr:MULTISPECIES: LysM peptidoglycan-binding domain-containing protein [unclassified Ensifer]OCP16554.1 peptidoglycan-binding protein LysM [Ensifer sp. LC54]OCP20254.1 peptidoglycan-binding protein LysM [Ensifer sp. LC384]